MTLALDLAGNIFIIPFITGHVSLPWYRWILGPLWKRLYPTAATDTGKEELRHLEVLGIMAREATEFMLPLAFATLYVICRHGRNGHYMAGVGVSIWHWDVPDLDKVGKPAISAYTSLVRSNSHTLPYLPYQQPSVKRRVTECRIAECCRGLLRIVGVARGCWRRLGYCFWLLGNARVVPSSRSPCILMMLTVRWDGWEERFRAQMTSRLAN